jgi:methyltransferase (TIGR00027 family)
MSLPNLSYMVSVGQLRYIQSAYEVPEHTNPDALIHHFLSPADLWGCRLRGVLAINRLRRNPFYYYVLARTRYYDSVFSGAIDSGVRHIMNIGCGSDTRAYRFADRLRSAQVSCVECDQEAAIVNKEKLARRRLDTSHVQFMAIDLNKPGWPDLDRWLTARGNEKILVMLEGVSPYIDEVAFTALLRLFATRLSAGCRVAYDYKLRGVADSFGQAQTRHVPFRLSGDAQQVARFHGDLGLQVDHLEMGVELVERTVHGIRGGTPIFAEDALLQLSPLAIAR